MSSERGIVSVTLEIFNESGERTHVDKHSFSVKEFLASYESIIYKDVQTMINRTASELKVPSVKKDMI